ncbi:MAG: glycosyltransferase family 4 protein, partial [Deltaproteobacteria bacterium]
NWIAVSEFAARALRVCIPANAPIRVIHNGINFNAFPEPKVTTTGHVGVRVLNAGSLEARKNQGLILDVAECFRDSQVVFLLAGDGPDRDKLALEISRRGLDRHIQLLGYRSDLPSLMRSCDIYLHVAIRENCPFVILEAIGAGLPVMSVDSGGIGELIASTSDEALVHGDRVLPVIEERLSVWVRQPEVRADIARRQYEYASLRFTLAHIFSKTRAYYQDILHESV